MIRTRLLPVLAGIALVCIGAAAQEKAQEDIAAEGVGLGSNKAEALMNAKRDAVEKGIGMVLVSQTEVENFMLKRDQVITKTLGAVKSYETLSETTTPDNLFEIKIKAVLSRATMHSDLAAFHILLETMDKPKIMIIVDENNVGNDQPTNKAAENAIIGFLKSPYDFEIVDPTVVASIRSSEQKMAKLKGDAAGAAAIGATYGAEVIITGSAVSRIAEGMSQNLGGMKSGQADVTLRAINCATGRIIASGDGHGAKVHISPNTAGTNAIKQASVKAVKSLLDAIIEDWNKQINNGIPLSVTVKGIATFRDKSAAVATLQRVPGVAAVRERGWNGDSKLLEADIQYRGNVNGFCSKVDGYKLKQGGSFLVQGVKGTRVQLVVQVR
ncbi:MAG: hypothetical protein GF418_17465 [Chitinivibrionales bacterium]|nr:hypothetical protein [Chitinivibrionales bacterium]MBD3397410.1 hypothetical protein [Chitinivibrionales bacterium]